MRDIFRKYPNKYEGILGDLCENLSLIEDPQAKAAMIWIIGEYSDIIENSNEFIENFLDNLREEPSYVQTQILTSSVKIFLNKPDESHELVKRVLQMVTEESENPDLRDRGFIYWRLLHTDPEVARQIVLAERPAISTMSYNLDSNLLDRLIENIGSLASVYTKAPENFVKKMRDLLNQR